MIAALVDIETTGFLDPNHRIVEVYFDLVDIDAKKVTQSYETRINPKRDMPADATRVHGITGAELQGSPDWESVGPYIHNILSKSDTFVAHNAEFDFSFLNQEFVRIGLNPLVTQVFCTMENGVWAAPTGKRPSLRELCFACGVEYDTTKAHAASYDVEVMRQCLFNGIDWGFYNLK